MPDKIRLALFCLIYCFPPTLIFVGIIDYEYRYHIMAPVILTAIIYAIWQKFSTVSLGMRADNFFPALIWQFGISVGLTLVVVLLVNTNYVRGLEPPQNFWFYPMYLFISGPVQEITYRSVPFAEMDRHSDIPTWMKISIIVFNFAWLHVIYFDWITFFATMFMGFIWTIIYHYKRNLWAVSIAHATCGFLAIWFGFV